MEHRDDRSPSEEAEEAQAFSEQLDELLGPPRRETEGGPIWPRPIEDPWAVTLPDVVRHEDFDPDGNGYHDSTQAKDQRSTKSQPRGGDTTPPPSQA